MLFYDEEHFNFFQEQGERLNPDAYLKALIYTIGICADTRRQWENIYNLKERSICPDRINEPWQTGTSLKVMRLAFQLFTDDTPTAHLYSDDDKVTEDFTECQKYSISDIFCCELAPFFVEAVRIRYPEYFTKRGIEK